MPKIDTPARTERIQMMMTPQDAEKIKAAAKKDDRSIGDWCRRVILQRLYKQPGHVRPETEGGES